MDGEKRNQNKKPQHIITCPECGAQLPLYTKEGKHNFCPKSTNNKGIIEVCMKCKMKAVVAHWRDCK